MSRQSNDMRPFSSTARAGARLRRRRVALLVAVLVVAGVILALAWPADGRQHEREARPAQSAAVLLGWGRA